MDSSFRNIAPIKSMYQSNYFTNQIIPPIRAVHQSNISTDHTDSLEHTRFRSVNQNS